MHRHMHVYAYTNIHTHTHILMHTHTSACTHMHKPYIHIYAHTHIYIHILYAFRLQKASLVLGVAEKEEGADFRVSNEDFQGEAMKQPVLSALGPASPWAQIACFFLVLRLKPSLPLLWAIVLAVLPENFSLKILRSTFSLTPGSSGRLAARPATPRQPQQAYPSHSQIHFVLFGALELPYKAPGHKLSPCGLGCYSLI